jgi:hypothetical protein
MILIIMWVPTAFAVVTAIESGCKFNMGYYVSKVLTRLSEWWCERRGENFRKAIVHADDARPRKATVSQQFMAQDAMVVAANPPSSSDLAPSDFCLFGHVKRLLRGESFGTGEQFLSAVERIARSFEKLTLTTVFLEWMMRPEQCIETNGDYIG